MPIRLQATMYKDVGLYLYVGRRREVSRKEKEGEKREKDYLLRILSIAILNIRRIIRDILIPRRKNLIENREN